MRGIPNSGRPDGSFLSPRRQPSGVRLPPARPTPAQSEASVQASPPASNADQAQAADEPQQDRNVVVESEDQSPTPEHVHTTPGIESGQPAEEADNDAIMADDDNSGEPVQDNDNEPTPASAKRQRPSSDDSDESLTSKRARHQSGLSVQSPISVGSDDSVQGGNQESEQVIKSESRSTSGSTINGIENRQLGSPIHLRAEQIPGPPRSMSRSSSEFNVFEDREDQPSAPVHGNEDQPMVFDDENIENQPPSFAQHESRPRTPLGQVSGPPVALEDAENQPRGPLAELVPQPRIPLGEIEIHQERDDSSSLGFDIHEDEPEVLEDLESQDGGPQTELGPQASMPLGEIDGHPGSGESDSPDFDIHVDAENDPRTPLAEMGPQPRPVLGEINPRSSSTDFEILQDAENQPRRVLGEIGSQLEIFEDENSPGIFEDAESPPEIPTETGDQSRRVLGEIGAHSGIFDDNENQPRIALGEIATDPEIFEDENSPEVFQDENEPQIFEDTEDQPRTVLGEIVAQSRVLDNVGSTPTVFEDEGENENELLIYEDAENQPRRILGEIENQPSIPLGEIEAQPSRNNSDFEIFPDGENDPPGPFAEMEPQPRMPVGEIEPQPGQSNSSSGFDIFADTEDGPEFHESNENQPRVPLGEIESRPRSRSSSVLSSVNDQTLDLPTPDSNDVTITIHEDVKQESSRKSEVTDIAEYPSQAQAFGERHSDPLDQENIPPESTSSDELGGEDQENIPPALGVGNPESSEVYSDDEDKETFQHAEPETRGTRGSSSEATIIQTVEVSPTAEILRQTKLNNRDKENITPTPTSPGTRNSSGPASGGSDKQNLDHTPEKSIKAEPDSQDVSIGRDIENIAPDLDKESSLLTGVLSSPDVENEANSRSDEHSDEGDKENVTPRSNGEHNSSQGASGPGDESSSLNEDDSEGQVLLVNFVRIPDTPVDVGMPTWGWTYDLYGANNRGRGTHPRWRSERHPYGRKCLEVHSCFPNSNCEGPKGAFGCSVCHNIWLSRWDEYFQTQASLAQQVDISGEGSDNIDLREGYVGFLAEDFTQTCPGLDALDQSKDCERSVLGQECFFDPVDSQDLAFQAAALERKRTLLSGRDFACGHDWFLQDSDADTLVIDSDSVDEKDEDEDDDDIRDIWF